MFLSVFDIFKVSVGPSSSHTMGPMLAARRFAERVAGLPAAGGATIECRLYGSLAYTGEGHGTHRAVLCGLLGLSPQTYDREAASAALEALNARKWVSMGPHRIRLDPGEAIIPEKGKRLDGHPNAMRFRLLKGEPDLLSEVYYSVGGGFVLSEAELAAQGGPSE
ncbi:serine dehydratase beta chain, partial [Devosia sp.]|uniref:serine dehydratase beta chain n=1 Tax=Devosia sp. TaxID=1871048 RepID=UPI0035B2F732